MKTIATSYLQSKNLRNVGYAMLLPRYKVCIMDVKYLKSIQVMFLVCKAKNEKKWNYQIFCIDFRGIGIVRLARLLYCQFLKACQFAHYLLPLR